LRLYFSLLIPHDITHVLKILIIDSRENRVQQAVAEGIAKKNAGSLMITEDQKAYDWTDFLYRKEAFDSSLYGIVLPVEKQNADKMVALIKENYYKQALLETDVSIQAVGDFALTAKVEAALLDKGQKVAVETRNGHVTL
jgi:hypothetical protein